MTEKEVHKNICIYLKYQFSDVIFVTDTSGIKLTIGQATQMKQLRSSRGMTDLMIFEPNKYYKALFIELKKEGEVLLKKDRTFKTNHLKEQHKMICNLNKKGYFACFCAGFDEAKLVIEKYMKNR